ncbi:MAG: CaiB/BaiF CoA transferase family protein [Gemmataceae bacterium]
MIPWDPIAPLAGIRVLEAARILAGPFCGQLLADYGADVVKLERPGTGDDTRSWGPPFFGTFSAYFLSCNRSKRSLTLDVATPEGQQTLAQLLSNADVLLENFRTDSLPRLHLTPTELLARHPRLIICSISGYGRTGPKADDPGYDFAIQAQSGLMSITGPPTGPPSKVGVAVVDILTGLYAATAILAALRARERSGHGYHIDVSLLDCAVAAQANLVQAYFATGQMPARQGNAHLQIVPYELFATADGWIVLNVGNDTQWRSFIHCANAPEWNTEKYATNAARVAQRTELIPLVAAVLRRQTTAEWVACLSAAGVPYSEVRDYPRVFADEQLLARGLRVQVSDPQGNPVDLLRGPVQMNAALREPGFPPALGADTAAVLAEWGVTR